MKKNGKIKQILLNLLLIYFVFAAVPQGYYDGTEGLSGNELRSALYHIIKGHTALSYTPGVWNAFATTDLKPNGKIWDMYTAYEYTYGTDQNTGSSPGREGVDYNREHSWPQSYFNSSSPMRTDLFHIYPTDTHVNAVRANYAYGETDTPTYTSTNGSKLGPARSGLGYSGTVFEPADEYKGDFARTYFYMATRYYGEDGNWSDWAMSDGAELKPWTVEMLLDWHRNDSVSTKETNRNNAVFASQNNRNPFIDNPEFVEYIWGDELPAPSALDATQVDSTSFRANWTSVAAASSYELYVSEDEAFITCLNAYDPKTLSANYELISGLEAASDYYYKVKAVDGDKESDLSNTVHVQTVSASTAVAEIPFSYVIGFAYPNPFNSDCVLPIELDKEMHMEIDVLDLSGRVQKEIHNGILHAGDHKLTLHVGGLRSGIYFIRVQTPQRLHVRKVLFIK